MRRRRFLSLVGLATVPGCTVPTRSMHGQRTIAAVTADPLSIPDLSASVARVADYTDAHPGAIRIELRNVGDQRRLIRFAATPPFDAYVGSDSQGARAFLVPEGTGAIEGAPTGVPYDKDRNGCFRLASGVAVERNPTTIGLRPGRAVSRVYAMVGIGEPCLPVGTYRFEDSSYLGGKPWGISIQLALEG